MKKYIEVKLDVEGLHSWPNCNIESVRKVKIQLGVQPIKVQTILMIIITMTKLLFTTPKYYPKIS